jgi:DNA mismatch repair protein MutL
LAGDDSPWSWCRVLGQIADGYIIIETDGGYAVVDPQAAHERVVYERMLAALEAAEPVSQQLLIPESVTLSPGDAARIQENISILRAMGFGLDPFGGRGEFIVDALPSGIEATDCRTLLADIAHGIETAGVRRGSEKWKEKAVAMGAARAAVPQVVQLHPEAMARLVNDLAHTKMPYTSPRGRPTMLFTSLSELARKFNRGGGAAN